MAANPIEYSRQVNITLPESMVYELEEIAVRLNRGIEDVFLLALGLLKVAVDAPRNRQKLLLVDYGGKPIKEITLR